MSRPLGRQGGKEGEGGRERNQIGCQCQASNFAASHLGRPSATFVEAGERAGDLPERTVVKLAGTLHVNPVLSLARLCLVRAPIRRGSLQYKNHQTHNFLLLDISRPEW